MAAPFVREVVFYESHFLDLYATLRPEAQRKIDWTLKLIATVEHVPVKYLKHLEGTDGMYEVRCESGSNAFRIFCFFDSGRLVVLLNGFQKKSRKTPKGEIDRAERLRKKYYDETRKA